MKLSRKFTLTGVLLIILTGCGEELYQHNQKTGNFVKIASFSNLDEGTRYSIDSELARESEGKHPSAGTKTWREYWEWRISLWRKENHRKYEDYFYSNRKKLRLRSLDQL